MMNQFKQISGKRVVSEKAIWTPIAGKFDDWSVGICGNLAVVVRSPDVDSIEYFAFTRNCEQWLCRKDGLRFVRGLRTDKLPLPATMAKYIKLEQRTFAEERVRWMFLTKARKHLGIKTIFGWERELYDKLGLSETRFVQGIERTIH